MIKQHPRICATCGYYGHFARECKKTLVTISGKHPTQKDIGLPTKEGDKSTTMPPETLVANPRNVSTNNSATRAPQIDDALHGEWLVVTRKKKRNVYAQKKKERICFNGKS